MTRRSGGFRGAKPTWTTTSTSGIFGMEDVVELKAAGQWPRGPVAPTGLTVISGDGQLSLSWTAPATPHGTITDYVVEYTPAAGSPTVVTTGSTAASYTLTGLTNGTEYTFRVAAVNYTRGDWSDSVARSPGLFTATATLLTPATAGSFVTPAGAKMLRAWAVGAGGSYSYNCDGGGNGFGQPARAATLAGFLTDQITLDSIIGAGVPFACDLDGAAPSTSVTLSSPIVSPMPFAGPLSSTGGNHRGLNAVTWNTAPAQGLGVASLWDVSLNRLFPAKFADALTLTGVDPLTHNLGRGGNSSPTALRPGGDGGVLLYFSDYEELTVAVFGTGSFTIPSAYSAVKVWAVGGGGVGDIYCDGGPTTWGGNGAVAVKTFANAGGQTLTYSVAPVLTGICTNPQNGGDTTAELGGVVVSGGGGLSSGADGTASGPVDTSGAVPTDVDGLQASYAEAGTPRTDYGARVYSSSFSAASTGGVLIVKFIV